MDSADTKINFSSPLLAISAKLQFIADFMHLPFKSSNISVHIAKQQTSELQSGTKSYSRFVVRHKVQISPFAAQSSRAISLFRSAAGQAPVSQPAAEFFISPIFSLPLAKAVSQMKPVCTAYDRILAIERLHTLTARTDECFNTYKSREGKNRARRDHSRAPCLDMLISYQLTTDKPDVEVRGIQVQKTSTCLQACTAGVQTRAL